MSAGSTRRYRIPVCRRPMQQSRSCTSTATSTGVVIQHRRARCPAPSSYSTKYGAGWQQRSTPKLSPQPTHLTTTSASPPNAATSRPPLLSPHLYAGGGPGWGDRQPQVLADQTCKCQRESPPASGTRGLLAGLPDASAWSIINSSFASAAGSIQIAASARRRFRVQRSRPPAYSPPSRHYPASAKPATRAARDASRLARLNRVSTGNSMALRKPCGTWKCALIGRDIPCCTKATELLVNVSCKRTHHHTLARGRCPAHDRRCEYWRRSAPSRATRADHDHIGAFGNVRLQRMRQAIDTGVRGVQQAPTSSVHNRRSTPAAARQPGDQHFLPTRGIGGNDGEPRHHTGAASGAEWR